MKKYIALSFVVAAGVAASIVFANNADRSTEESVAKIPPCQAKFATCPDGSQALRCTRKGGVPHPTCTQADQNGMCEIAHPCR